MKAKLIDGGSLEWSEGHSFLERYDELLNQGVEGRELIDSLITDDWGAPPIFVEIEGIDANGANVSSKIVYA